MRRALKEMGARCVRPVRRPGLTQQHRAARVAFARKWLRLTWRNVMVSDSKFFYFNPKSKDEKVWVLWDGQPPTQQAQRGGYKVHVYAAVSKWGATPLFVTAGTTGHTVEVEGKKHKTVDGEVYRELLHAQLLPACRQLMNYRYGNDWVFQQDGASAHTATKTLQYLRSKEFRLMENWPSRSPDLSWIENLWAHVERELRQRAHTLTIENFIPTLHQVWDEIPLSVLENLHASIHRRLKACIDMEGGNTMY